MKTPEKVSENSAIPALSKYARSINQIIEYMTANTLRDSPNVRIERSVNGVHPHVIASKVGTNTESGGRWL